MVPSLYTHYTVQSTFTSRWYAQAENGSIASLRESVNLEDIKKKKKKKTEITEQRWQQNHFDDL